MKNNFKQLLTIISFLVACTAQAQEYYDISENKPIMINGVEYNYVITNESTVQEYNRFEIVATATNKSGCQLIYINRRDIQSWFEGDPAAIARFDCINANGKRLTSKGANLKAAPFYVPHTRYEKQPDGKSRTIYENIRGGYLLANGHKVTEKFIVLTNEGKPQFRIRTQKFSDLSNTSNN
jgi:hypothetical protein